MSKDELHNIFSKKYGGENFSIDREEFWNELEPKLPSEDRRRFLIIVLFGGLLMILSLLASRVFDLPDNAPSIDQDYNASTRPENSSKAITESKIIDQSKEAKQLDTENTIEASKTSKILDTQHRSVKYSTAKSVTLERENHELINNKNGEQSKFLQNLPQGEDIAIQSINEEIEEVPNGETEDVPNLMETRMPLIIQQIGTIGDPQDLESAHRSINMPYSYVVVVKQQFRNQGITLYSEYISFSSNLNTEQSEFDPYIGSLNSSFKEMFGISVGIEKQVNLNRNFSLTGGLEYMQLNQKFEINNVTTETITQSLGEGYIATERNKNRYVYHTNHHQYLNIPLSIDHTIRKGSIKLINSIGYTLNVFRASNGKYLNEEGEVTSFSNFDESFYQKRVGGFINYGIRGQFDLTDFDIGIQFGIAKQIGSSLVNDKINSDLRLYKFGVNIKYPF